MSIAPTAHKGVTTSPPRIPIPVSSGNPSIAAGANDLADTPRPAPGLGRLASLDAYRGLVMVLMISAGLQIGHVVARFDKTPGWEQLHTPAWDVLNFHTEHTQWTGCALWDLIQPSFMFMVGTALTFSIASRRAKGEGFGRMLVHALVRSGVLVLLAVFLTSAWSKRTDWVFTNVLAQIGLGYPFLFLLAWLKARCQFLAATLILIGCWIAFTWYPTPPENFKLLSVNFRPFSVHVYHADPAKENVRFAAIDSHREWWHVDGFASDWEKNHWEKDTNVAARVDRWFLNVFPRAKDDPFTANKGGYQTLNFVPSLATMIFGLLAGELLRARLSGHKKVGVLLAAGLFALAAGWALARFGICPVGKRIWTPAWAIFSAGWAFLALGLFYLILDVWRVRRWEYPLVIVGANSIAIYCVSQLLKPFVRESARRHLGADFFEWPGHAYAWLRYRLFSHAPMAPDTLSVYGNLFSPMAEAGFFLLVCWLLCWWAYRKKLFIKI